MVEWFGWSMLVPSRPGRVLVRVCLSTVGSCRRVIDRAGRAATLALNEITYMEEIGKVLEENIRLIWYKQLHKQL